MSYITYVEAGGFNWKAFIVCANLVLFPVFVLPVYRFESRLFLVLGAKSGPCL